MDFDDFEFDEKAISQLDKIEHQYSISRQSSAESNDSVIRVKKKSCPRILSENESDDMYCTNRRSSTESNDSVIQIRKKKRQRILEYESDDDIVQPSLSRNTRATRKQSECNKGRQHTETAVPSTSTNPPTNLNVIDLSSSIQVVPSTTSNNNFQIVPSTTSDLKMKIQKIPNTKSDNTSEPTTSDKTDAKIKEEEEDSQIEDELLCAICSEMFVKATTLNCSHTFCRYCINKWKSKQSVCPICRTKITSLVPTLVLDNVIEKAVHTLSKGAQEHRQELLKERMNSDEPSTVTVLGEVNMVTEIDSNEETSSLTSSDTSDNTDEMEEEYWNDDWYDGRRRRPYYGGYGTCYVCHNTGHWANSCPFR